MRELPQRPLSEFFDHIDPIYVLGTTYSISPAFFEGLVFPQIGKENLRRCLLLCDRTGFQRAVVEASALRQVSREYMIARTPAKYSFHSKVWLLIGEEQVVLLVGSGNLTQSGFMDNAELFDTVILEKGGNHRKVVEDIVVFLSGIRSLWTGEETERLLIVETLREMQEVLAAFAREMPTDDESDVRFLTNFHGPLSTQFQEYFSKNGTIHLAVPYFGNSITGLLSLKNTLSPVRIRVFPAIGARSVAQWCVRHVEEAKWNIQDFGIPVRF